MTDVFLSYSREDQQNARLFAEGFEHEGFSVWWDQALNPGEAFDQVTERALAEARAVVVLWSKKSVDSRWVRAEATQAHADGRLIPVMIEPCKRPIMFELTHTADLSVWNGDTTDAAWQAFVRSVRRFVERIPPAVEAGSGRTPAIPGAQDGVRASPSPPPRRAATAKRAQGTRRDMLRYGGSALALGAAALAGATLRGLGRDGTPVQSPGFQRVSFRRGLIRSARFAPDGQSILYGALWEHHKCRVHSARVDSPETSALDLPEANLLAVSRSGELALSLGGNEDGVFTYGTLARVPGAGGSPREMLEAAKFADWSADGTELAVIRSMDGSDRLEYPIGTVLFAPKPDEGTGLGFVRIAPDGRRMAFVHYRAPQSLLGRVCVMDMSGKLTKVTDDYVNIHGLAWRGEEIWYSASEDRPLFRAIMAVRPGAAPRVVARVPVNVTVWDCAADGRLLIAQTDDRAVMIARVAGRADDRDLSWLDASWVADVSRDGQKVLFSETGQGVSAVPAAYLRGVDGSPAVRLGSGMPLALSPDQRSALILEGGYAAGAPRSTIRVVPTGVGEMSMLPGADMECISARWLPDGRQVILQAAAQGTGPRLFRIDMPDGRPEPVSPVGVIAWAISPDGSRVAWVRPGGGIQILRLGDAPGPVPGSVAVGRLLGWIDAGLLVAPPDAAARGDIALIDPESGRKRPWANILPKDSAGIMLLAAFSASQDGHTIIFSWHRATSNLYLATGLA
jgi:hypothetical protein